MTFYLNAKMKIFFQRKKTEHINNIEKNSKLRFFDQIMKCLLNDLLFSRKQNSSTAKKNTRKILTKHKNEEKLYKINSTIKGIITVKKSVGSSFIIKSKQREYHKKMNTLLRNTCLSYWQKKLRSCIYAKTVYHLLCASDIIPNKRI